MSAAARVAAAKRKHPDNFCAAQFPLRSAAQVAHDFCTHQTIKDRTDLIAPIQDLYDACNGLLRLLSLIAARGDVSDNLRKTLWASDLIVDAKDAIAKVEARKT